MRHVVMLDDVREIELWPSKLFDKYLKLTEKDLKKFFVKKDLVEITCPACNSTSTKEVFIKYGLSYKECNKCKTLFLSPRPKKEKIQKYYKESKAIEFWYAEIYKHTSKKRTIHQSKPRAMWIANLTEEFLSKPYDYLSINAISQDFLEEIVNLNLFKNKFLYEPSPYISTSFINEKKFENINKNIGKSINVNIVSAFGVMDRVFSPQDFIKKARSFLIDEGIFFMTASTISGFDLQILWNNSKSIYPPDRINLISTEGFTTLLEDNGFKIIEISTPGQLDIELVKNTLKNNKKMEIPRFISYMLENREENAHYAFQEFLQHFKLSSHIRIAAKKLS